MINSGSVLPLGTAIGGQLVDRTHEVVQGLGKLPAHLGETHGDT